ncbi:SID1 transmembrane family member 1-like [Paramacrobiotus metropolitanus]|uniref:SID1 transmembrane family member 1-like n=1 Tax=Paramacrobiotus metropolitanus TaxID=2943436 RepID=UPI002445D498|nr:SID1 transmembrane family member 1-like [Paramacrobiotus metropolitanus]
MYRLYYCFCMVVLINIKYIRAESLWSTQALNQTATFNVPYYGQVDNRNPIAYHFTRQLNTFYDGAVRLTVGSVDASEEEPILIIVKRQRTVRSWQLPLIMEENHGYSFFSRTLCPLHNHASTEIPLAGSDEFYVEIFSVSSTRLSYSLMVATFPGFSVSHLPNFELRVSPSEPQYVHYRMQPATNRVVVKVNATVGDTYCSYLSIQSVRCPVGDLEADLRLDGRYQTVTSRAAIEVTRAQFPSGEFYIVVLVHTRDDDCTESRGLFSLLQRHSDAKGTVYHAPRYKTVNVTVIESLDAEGYILATVVPVLIFLGFFILSVVLLQTGPRTWRGIFCTDLSRVTLPTAEEKWGIAALFEKSITGKDIPSLWDPDNYEASNSKLAQMVRKLRASSDPNVQLMTESAPKTVNLTGFDSTDGQPGALTLLHMADINRKSASLIKQTSREYGLTLITVFIFYSLPVLQLVMTHQGLLVVTGNEDICYYNFSCANTVGVLSDFNHILSNVGYVLLGLLFILLVRRKSIFTSKLRQTVPSLDEYGIPSQIGLFYGMGMALTMEGVMSACYHVCPSYNNFQFDTSFMYLIAGLLLLKLYHARHPDVLPQSYAAYALFAGFILIAVVGVVSRHIGYWIAFSVIHGIVTVVLFLQILFVGYLEWSFAGVRKGMKEAFATKRGERMKIPTSRIVLSTLILLTNLLFVISGPLLRPYDFASHLLFILQANLLIYASFYVGMKMMDPDERISRASCLYFFLALPAWGVGMYYFTRGLSNWELSAAKSREGNRECFFFEFYDEHDVWHMCSAIGLFFTFMMLLTLDDDLATVTRDQITVF